MINVSVILSADGVIEELAAEGHAGWAAPGNDIVCAAFTVLLRTFGRTVEASPAVLWSIREDRVDRFHLVVSGVKPEIVDQYRGWCEFLLRGIEDLQGDAPGRVRIKYGNHSGG